MAPKVRILPGKEGDTIVKAPSISQKLIVLKGLKLNNNLPKFETIITSEIIISELIERAKIVKKFKELPHCVVIYDADILLTDIAAEKFNIELDIISNVRESKYASTTYYYTEVDFDTSYPDDYEPEPFNVPEDVEMYIEEIEKSFEESAEEDVEKEEVEPAVVEVADWIPSMAAYGIKVVPLVNVQIEDLDEEAEIPVEIVPKKPIVEKFITATVSASGVIAAMIRCPEIKTASTAIVEYEVLADKNVIIKSGRVETTIRRSKEINKKYGKTYEYERVYINLSIRLSKKFAGQKVSIHVRIVPKS